MKNGICMPPSSYRSGNMWHFIPDLDSQQLKSFWVSMSCRDAWWCISSLDSSKGLYKEWEQALEPTESPVCCFSFLFSFPQELFTHIYTLGSLIYVQACPTKQLGVPSHSHWTETLQEEAHSTYPFCLLRNVPVQKCHGLLILGGPSSFKECPSYKEMSFLQNC